MWLQRIRFVLCSMYFLETLLQGVGVFHYTDDQPMCPVRIWMGVMFVFDFVGSMIYLMMGLHHKDYKLDFHCIAFEVVQAITTMVTSTWCIVTLWNPTCQQVWNHHFFSYLIAIHAYNLFGICLWIVLEVVLYGPLLYPRIISLCPRVYRVVGNNDDGKEDVF
jgi:hypothetical protein